MRLKTSFFNLFRRLLINQPAERWLLRLVRGASPGSLRARVLPNHYQYRKPSWRTAVRHGMKLELDISDLVDWAVYFGLREEEQEHFFSSIPSGSVVLDAGANIGSTMLRFSRAVGPHGRVIGFEPDPKSYLRCQRNIFLNSLFNVTLEQIALGEEAGFARLSVVDERNPGMNRILPAAEENAAPVELTTIDDYLEKNGILKIDAIKIDVEGFELKVLRGAERTIERSRPRILLEASEPNLRQQGDSVKALEEFLRQRGARVTQLPANAPIPANVCAQFKAEILCEFPVHPLA